MAARVTASIVTIGNELLSGDTVNTNAAWLAQQLEELGVVVTLMASLPDEIDRVAEFVRTESDRADIVLVTGGLGGTPDDITREAIAAAFEAPQDEVADLAASLRSRFPSDPEYAARWANLPAGARPLENPLGGAPGFVVGNVYVMPGLPAEMKAMFATVTPELETERPITSWRRTYETTEAKIVGVLEAMGDRYPGVLVGSYPKFHEDGATVEVVVKSADPAALEAAVAWLEQALEEATELERVGGREVAVAADVAVLRPDDEQDEVLVADARDAPRRRRLHVHDPARAELERVPGDVEARASAVDEVELVLLVVEVGAADDAGRQHERVDAEGRDAKLAAHLAEDAVAHLVDRPEGVAHARKLATSNKLPNPV